MADERLVALIAELHRKYDVPLVPLVRAIDVIDRGGSARAALDEFEATVLTPTTAAKVAMYEALLLQAQLAREPVYVERKDTNV